jgi:CubicO group peptidase (beta-lactamase class C family)
MKILIILTITFLFLFISNPHKSLIPKSKIQSPKSIDSIALDGIAQKAFPGCQIYIMVDGKVFYNKSFGYHTYNNSQEVLNSDLYDIASLTKIAATTICLMKLSDEGKFKIDDHLSKYLPYLLKTSKEHITIREILAHQAGLKAWIPFYKSTLTIENNLNPEIYIKDSKFKIQNSFLLVADSIFIIASYKDSIFKQIVESQINKSKYLYSDLGFYLFADLILKITGKTIDQYAYENFYKPMQLSRITYNPLNKFQLKQIIPTEYDSVFRKQLLQGYVHDPGAAMLGGISGHAGLFSDAESLAQIMQMLIDNGIYKGKQYLSPNIIKEFTRYQFPANRNRRGLGFDKPLLNPITYGSEPLKRISDSPCCASASPLSFGHSGFTGTFLWADPKYKIVYVFLSNRVYPTANNHKIINMNIRTKIQQAIYDQLRIK